jgi:SpoVK/Ycf46/Vps4 family AAA+-type ATPase
MQRVSHEESRLQTLMDSIRSEVEKNMANGLADLAAKSIRAFISQRMDDPAYQLLAFLYLLLGRILVQSEGARSAYDPLHFAQNHATDPLLKAEAMFRITCVHLGGDALVARENAKRASERTIRQLLPSLDDAFCAIYPDLAGLRNMLHDRLLSIEAQSAARQQAELQAQAKGRQRKREQDESIEALAAVRQREAAEAAFSRSADLASLKWSNALQQEEDDMRTAKTITEQGGSALHVSASLGRLDDVILLLKEGADPAERDHKGDTPLHLACRARRLDVVRVLLDVSPWVAVNQNGKTPIDDGLRIGTSKDGEPVLSDDDTSVYVQDVIQKVLEDDEKAEISRRWACQRTLGAQCPALDKLMNLIGLRRVKEEALLLYDQVSIDLRRPIDARTTTTQAMNFIFLGNPGTGKTTVSRLLAQMLQELGLRESTSTFVETSGQELLDKGAAEFSKTLTAAPPGVLFIDEINQLDPINNQVGRSITNSILLAAENSRSRLSIIVAGYASEVNEKWLASNDGLRSRFPYIVHFDDFTENELRDIFIDIVRTKGWRIQPTAKPLGVPDEQPFVDIPMVAARRLARGASLRGFANARSARIMVEASMRRADQRLKKTLQVGGVRGSDLSSHALTTLTRPDILGRPINEQESSIMKELFAMTGLADVKKNVSALVQLCSDNFAREERGERPFDMSLHRVFLGNPGTGKTSIAKIYGKILKELGYLSDGEVIVKGASAFMGQYVGSTGAAVNRILNEARGKVLVIDEAYAFCTNRGDGGMGGTLNFGTEAIDTLVERIQPGGYEDMAVILCGYESEMRTMFRDMNPGLESRFQLSKAFIFADYTKDELVDIMLFQAQKRDMSVSKELAVKAVSEVLEKLRRRPNFGNARAVSTLLDTAIERQSARFRADPGQQAGRYFTDIDFFEPPKGMGAAYDTLRGLLNTEHIIGRFQRLEKSIRVLKANGRSDTSSLLSNWSFVGPPGTGKTTVGRALAELYHGLGLLASPLCIECKATELIGAYIGQTAPRVRKKMDDALGGVLFIDEAYGLDSTRSTFAQDAQEALLANMTDPKYQGKLVVVLAGYESHIQALMMGNPGMYRRFPERLEFSPWDATACTNLVQHCLSREGIDLPIGLTSSVMTGFEDLQRREGWGNAGDAVTVARKIQEASHQRCDEQGNVTGPLLLEDVSTAFSDLKKRRLNGTDVSRERYSQLPAATVAQTTAESPVQCASEGPGESAPAALGPAVATSPDPEQQADVTENDSPPTTQAALSSDPDIVASLDDAVARLGYDAYRVRDIAASAVFPLELLELVARIAGSSVSRVHPLLVAQCPAVLQNATVAIWQQEEEARLKQQEEERIARAEENERARLRMLADAERAKRVGAYICGVCGRQGCPVRPIWREGVISGPLYNGDNGPAVTAPPPE